MTPALGRIKRANSCSVFGTVRSVAEPAQCLVIIKLLLHTDQTLGSPTEGSPPLTPGFSSKLNRRRGSCHFLRGQSSVSPLQLSAFPAVSYQNLISGNGLSQNPSFSPLH